MRFPPDLVLPDILQTLGVDPAALLGSGSEASVYALDADRVLRIHRAGPTEASLARRKALLDELAPSTAGLPFAIPRVLEVRKVKDRIVSRETRLEGRPLSGVLRESRGLRRGALLSSYLDAAASLAGDGRLAGAVAAAYLPDTDQPTCSAWLEAQGLAEPYPAVRRWVAAFWAFATDDSVLGAWCRAVLLK